MVVINLLFGSAEQLESITLRDLVLRKPLGLFFTREELESEKDQIHIGCLAEGVIVGVLLLKKTDLHIVKMRQVAVTPNLQGKGIGKKMVDFAEKWSKANNYTRIELHARKSAVPFYLSMQYSLFDEEFEEVGIPHYFMFKEL